MTGKALFMSIFSVVLFRRSMRNKEVPPFYESVSKHAFLTILIPVKDARAAQI